MIVSYNCQGCSSAPLMQYKNNEIYEEMIAEDEFRTNERDDRILINMRRSKGYTDELKKLNRDDSGIDITVALKKAAAEKLRLTITGLSQAEHWYLLSSKGILCHTKTLTFQKQTNYNFINNNNNNNNNKW